MESCFQIFCVFSKFSYCAGRTGALRAARKAKKKHLQSFGNRFQMTANAKCYGIGRTWSEKMRQGECGRNGWCVRGITPGVGYGIPSRRVRREKRRAAGRVCLSLARRYNTLDLAGKVSVPRGCGPFGNPGDEGRWAASLPVLQAGARDAFWCRRSSAMREMIQERGAHAHQRASAAKAAIHIVGIGFILLDAMDGRSRECDRVQHLKKIAGLHRYRCQLLPEDGVSFRLSPVGDWLRQAWTAGQRTVAITTGKNGPVPAKTRTGPFYATSW